MSKYRAAIQEFENYGGKIEVKKVSKGWLHLAYIIIPEWNLKISSPEYVLDRKLTEQEIFENLIGPIYSEIRRIMEENYGECDGCKH